MTTKDSSHEVGPAIVVTRVVSADSAARLQARLVELKCRDQVILIDSDGGSIVKGAIGTGMSRVEIVINRWNPEAPLQIRISGASPSAVARVNARLWPTVLHLNDLLGVDAPKPGDTSQDI